MSRLKILEPEHIIYILIALVIYGYVRNYQVLQPDCFAVMIASVATAISVGVLLGFKKHVD